jgi:hypothetical protein
MELEINRIQHNYIVKIVIFSIFLFKKNIKEPTIYKKLIDSYIKKRIPWKINLLIDTGIDLEKAEKRDIIMNEVLYNIKSDIYEHITVTFTTPLKRTSFKINLKNEKKYEKFIYR